MTYTERNNEKESLLYREKYAILVDQKYHIILTIDTNFHFID